MRLRRSLNGGHPLQGLVEHRAFFSNGSQLLQPFHPLLLKLQPSELVAYARVPALVVDVLFDESLDDVFQSDNPRHVHLVVAPNLLRHFLATLAT